MSYLSVDGEQSTGNSSGVTIFQLAAVNDEYIPKPKVLSKEE